jgi:hypothetical protein
MDRTEILMNKKEWDSLKVGQIVYYGPKKIPRVIKDISLNKGIILDKLHKSRSDCPETICPKNERRKFFLTK